tara:strand:+ start:91 stop:420 length:330 start_codon:yes stop_codon:yes gene_type:complete
MDQGNSYQPPSFRQQSASLLIIILVLLTVIAILVMLPSAIASWYSKCYNISLGYGFAIVFSSVLLGLISLFFPVQPFTDYILLFNGIVMACLLIYGVFLQFGGNCNLGK